MVLKPKILVFSLLILVAIGLRLFNLDRTARFLWDESSDLVRMHEIYVDHKITLVGPISEDGLKVFSSLTYYLYMPAAVIGRWDPVSPAYGAAILGLVTTLSVAVALWRVNRKLKWAGLILAAIWIPLLITGRWAWNPNLIFLWGFTGITLYFKKSKWAGMLSGLFMGFMVHQHFLAIFAPAAFGILIARRRWEWWMGVILALVPFVIFDLRHPPGLFLTRYLQSGTYGQTVMITIESWLSRVRDGIWQAGPVMIAAGGLVIWDLKQRNFKVMRWLGVWLVQIMGVAAAPLALSINGHYLYPGLPFLLLYIWHKREGWGRRISLLGALIMIAGSAAALPGILTKTGWESDIRSTRAISNFIKTNTKIIPAEISNIAVLGSPDPNTYGRKFRDVLLIDNIVLKDKYNYFSSDHLYVVSLGSEEQVRNDAAAEMTKFRKGKLEKTWTIPDSDWKLYLFSRG